MSCGDIAGEPDDSFDNDQLTAAQGEPQKGEGPGGPAPPTPTGETNA